MGIEEIEQKDDVIETEVGSKDQDQFEYEPESESDSESESEYTPKKETRTTKRNKQLILLLLSYMMFDHENEQYQCSLCTYSSKYKGRVSLHLKTAHKKEFRSKEK